MDFKEAVDEVLRYLKENGSANMSELQRELNCGRQLIYDVIGELESSGRVRSSISRGKRVVVLTGVVPSYLKILSLATSLVAYIMWIFFSAIQPKIVIKNMGSSVAEVSHFTPVPYFVIGMLVGIWIGVFVLRTDDISESVFSIKRTLNRYFEKITASKNIKF